MLTPLVWHCGLRRCRFWVSPGVVGECRAECAAELLALKAGGALSFIDDAEIPAARVLELLAQFGLDPGETESIAACESLGYSLCSDDGAARKLAAQLLGTFRVIGSLRILRWCVEERVVRCSAAFGVFGTMRDRGGFLPSMDQGFFCSGLPHC